MKKTILVSIAAILMIGCKGDLPEPHTRQIEGVPNAVQVGDLLFAGQVTEAALADLAKAGYKTILNTRGAEELAWDERAAVEALGMTYVSIPMPYPIHEISDEQVRQFDALLKNGQRPMLLHCSSGNRVSGLWAVWLVEHAGIDPREALRLAERTGMTRIRPNVEQRLAKRRPN